MLGWQYACRKTLADNRPRVRGRFARNDETGEIPKPTCFNRYEDDDDLWVFLFSHLLLLLYFFNSLISLGLDNMKNVNNKNNKNINQNNCTENI